MRILRKPDVEAKVGLGSHEFDRLERDGVFPKRFPIVPGGRVVGWLEREIDDWIANRAASREAA